MGNAATSDPAAVTAGADVETQLVRAAGPAVHSAEDESCIAGDRHRVVVILVENEALPLLDPSIVPALVIVTLSKLLLASIAVSRRR